MNEPFDIIDYQRQYREEMLALLFYSRHTHTHLDWYKAAQWLDSSDSYTLLAMRNGDIIGYMGISRALHGTVWLRLVCIAQGFDPLAVLLPLWEAGSDALTQAQVKLVSVLAINPWLIAILPELGFSYFEDVVTLYRPPGESLPVIAHHLDLRSGYLDDIPAILAVDHAAFSPVWQMNALDIRQAQRQAASCTLAQHDGETIGYEISTRHHTSGHLARLAVHPRMQGQRVGAALLAHLLERLEQRGVRSMTVNTQQSNIASQRLYRRFGFIHNGFDLAIWQQNLA